MKVQRCVAFVLMVVAGLGASLSAQLPPEILFKSIRQHVIGQRGIQKVDIAMTVRPEGLTIERKKQAPLVIPFSAVTGITYDRRSRMRKMAPTYGKAIDHFITIHYKVGEAGDFVEIEAEKDVAAPLVNVLEARSGRKIERTGGA